MSRMRNKMKPNLTCGTITRRPEDSISYRDKKSKHQLGNKIWKLQRNITFLDTCNEALLMERTCQEEGRSQGDSHEMKDDMDVF